ncbi:MAG: hypothetical protein ACYSWU_28710 [Planctomycetota bacterium]|jgi:hypothetical protein
MSSNVTKLPHAKGDTVAPHPLSLQAAMERSRGARRKTALIAGGGSAVWIAACLVYALGHVGGETLAGLALHEAGAAVAGVAMPMVVLWLVVLYMRRGGELREQTDMLRAQLELLTYPPDDAESRVRAVTDSLRGQAEALDRVTDTATIQMEKLSKTLGGRTEALAEV